MEAPSMPLVPRRKLTPRQIEVITLVARGYCYKEIAEKLGIAPATVSAHTQEIGYLFNGFDKVQMTHFAIVGGLVQAGDYRT